ncbi:MAG: hypothetical protein HN742_01115 [Lentisphaerae bacterium]|jgi:long-chain fatty acid transport protein|nr:hypothetical protein [Lentisphaerota bacterium]MBT5606116.1 hypothetical protein [Lentisphaerota bacterium]MBT7840433.1 hypothetical protein [Lentisphaerota bacterium]
MQTKHPTFTIMTGCLTALALLLLGATSVQAGGAKIPNQSTRAMGMSDAFVGGADDASAVYYNPAGLSNLTQTEVISNLYGAHATITSDDPGGSETSDGRYYFIPSLYMGGPVGESGTSLGLGIYSPFGLGTRWADDVATRWAQAAAPGTLALKLSEIQLVTFNPVISQKITDDLSLACGLNYFKSRVILRGQLNYGPSDGEVDLDMKGHGWGYNLGLQWRYSEDITVGLTCRSEVKVGYEGDVERKDSPFGPPNTTSDAELDIRYPLSIAGGVCWQATPKLRLELAAEWMEWSTWDEMVVFNQDAVLGPAFTMQRQWDDSWIIMIGGEYQLNEKWTLRAGYSFNETPVPDSTVSVDLPTGDTHAIGLGAGYKYSDTLSFDAAVNVAYGLERDLNNGVAPAGSEFEAISTYVSLGVNYTF